MADIRYVVLSDLHFGATNSVLTALVTDATQPGGYRAEPTQATPLLGHVLAGLRRLCEGQATLPALILAGDVLDLALSPDEVSATAFEQFADLAFGAEGPGPVFGPVIYYLPGNHDHHLWEVERELNYASYIRDLPPNQTIGGPRHTTSIEVDRIRPSQAGLLATLIKRRPGCTAVEMRVAYPNLALVTPDGQRAQVVSHGHFSESIYTLMSRLRETLFPEPSVSKVPASIETLERENFAWIDFFWSTLGRSGQVGVDVGLVYADLQSSVDLAALAGNLADSVASGARVPEFVRPIERALLRAALRHEAQHLARSERGTPEVTLGDKSRDGLRAYLEGPVLAQLQAELGTIPPELGFVFGHTHKPFVDRWTLAGYPGPVTLANDGGWVVDTATPALSQGGAAVLLDGDLNAATLQLYRQTSAGAAPVQLLTPPAGAGANPLVDQVRAAVDADAEPWRSVTESAADLIAERWRLQANLLSRAQGGGPAAGTRRPSRWSWPLRTRR